MSNSKSPDFADMVIVVSSAVFDTPRVPVCIVSS